ncbi:MAG TPA: hypothetical protein VGQ62_14375 [Chloroflexota bacterium]|nr:hypothetical protein [Chloroflexota bacterium]
MALLFSASVTSAFAASPDVTRATYTPVRSYSGVLLQQGRVQTDSDWSASTIVHCYLIHC